MNNHYISKRINKDEVCSICLTNTHNGKVVSMLYYVLNYPIYHDIAR